MHEPRACYTELSKSEGEKQIWYINAYIWNLGFPGGSDGKVSACSAGDLGSIPGLRRYPGEGNGYPLQCSGLENSMNCIVHGVVKSRT